MEINKEFLSNPFLLTEKEIKKDKFFEHSKQLSSSIFYYTKDTNYQSIELNGEEILLIGYILDIRNELLEENEVLNNLLLAYTKKLDIFLDELEFMNGRFVLIISGQEDTFIFTDATSMLPLFHYQNKFFSSHELILREFLKFELDIELKKYEFKMKNFLDYSNTKEIFSFNPNLMFSYKDKSFHRIFPREEYQNNSLDKVMEKTIPYLENQIKWLDNHYDKIYLSLTGGFDSKLSLALVKPIIDKIFTFTYMYKFDESTNYKELSNFKKIYYKDKIIVDNLVDNFRLNNHKYFFFSDYKAPSEYIKTLGNHVSSHHSYGLSYIFTKEFDRSSIHLKSTLYELAKLSFKDTDDDNLIINDIKHWAPMEIYKDKDALKNMYKNYKERNLTDEIKKYDFNVQTMLYWEFRMGNWHSKITQETDFVIDTYILINNRYMLKQLISLSREDRNKKLYLKQIVKKYWPALNYFIANSFETLEGEI